MSARRSRVAARWRIAGAALAGALALAGWLHPPTIDVLFRVDARLIDLWQRLSGEDEPSGEVVVIGVDSAAIREKGRWPWSRGDIAELVELVADAGARSLTLDVLLTEPGPYADVNLFRTFRQNAPEAIELLPESPDARLAEALDRLPVALAVAAGAEEAIADLSAQTFCADAARLTDAEARPYYVQCLLLPLEMFEARADAYAVAFAEQDLDGVVRRARAFVAQPYETADGEKAETIVTAMPVATVTACAGVDRGCLSFERDMPFLREVEANLSGYRMPLTRAEGPSPPPVPMTPSFGLWLDFGALRALGPGGEGPSRMISAAAVFQGDPDETARIEGKHAVVGYTRLGGIDQHTTPLAAESGTPGVLIQALAADNLIAGRVLAAPAWGRHLGLGFAAAAALLALVRFGARNLARLTAIGVALIAAPVAASWLAFEFGGTILNGATPAIAATLAWTPVLFGRIVAIRRDLATVRETAARDEARMAA
ncbi:MAG: CHASE2 domain-containing protein, partial [Pseudomonadota bacterium]